MADGRHHENRKIAISQPGFERFRQSLARRRSSTLLSVTTVKNLKFPKSKMAAAAILKIANRPYLRNGSTDLREILQGDTFWPSEGYGQLKFRTFEKSKMADSRQLCEGLFLSTAPYTEYAQVELYPTCCGFLGIPFFS